MNYSPFLLEAAAAVWGMDFFNEYRKGQTIYPVHGSQAIGETGSFAQ
jgi:hypothetical protein